MPEPRRPRDFKVQEELAAAAQVVSVTGEVDLATAAQLDSALVRAERAGSGALVLDLCDVGFIDSTGLRVVLGSIRRLTGEGRSLTVACPDGPVRRLFELTALTGQFDLHESRAAALGAVQD